MGPVEEAMDDNNMQYTKPWEFHGCCRENLSMDVPCSSFVIIKNFATAGGTPLSHYEHRCKPQFNCRQCANIDSNKDRTATTVSVWAKTHFRKFLPQILAKEKIDCLNTVYTPLAVFLDVLIPQGMIWWFIILWLSPRVFKGLSCKYLDGAFTASCFNPEAQLCGAHERKHTFWIASN